MAQSIADGGGVCVCVCDLMTQTLMAETPIGSPSGVCALSLPAPSRTPWRRAAQMREAGYGCIVINVINCDKGSAGYYIFIKNLSKIAVGLSPLPQILVSY